MRIVGGVLCGQSLLTPRSVKIRPASDKIRQAIYNILGSIDGLRVLDLFAGTGAVGFEALSRGAHHVTFVDQLPEALGLLHKNAVRLGLDDRSSIIKGRLPHCVCRLKASAKPFELVFIDPPYDCGLVVATLRALRRFDNLVDAESRIIIEHSPRELAHAEGFRLEDERKYGQTRLSILTLKPR